MRYLTGITLLLIIFSSHAIACESMKKNKSASVLNKESTENTQVQASSVSDKRLIAEESRFSEEYKKSMADVKK
ncbi:MAG: hypothetical protein AAF304_02965 [Pseudomonadota bacterium]